jgi:uncharacterized protein
MLIDEDALPAIALGCSVLGAGGGGESEAGMLGAMQAIRQYGPVEVVDLDDLPADALVMPVEYIGAPLVSLEKLGNPESGDLVRTHIEQEMGQPVAALMAGEIGGSNGLVPILWAARMGLPVADADGMGRAFPEAQHTTMEIAGISPTPSVIADERGNWLTVHAQDAYWLERLNRALSVVFGGDAAQTSYPMTVAQARTGTARGTVTLASKVGTAMMTSDDPFAALEAELSARQLVSGKIVDVERRVEGGWVRGAVLIEGLATDSGRLVRLEIQNENLVAIEDGVVRAMVPDIITVLDSYTATPIHTERLSYGQRVTVVGMPADPIWRTDKGLALAGPRAFGYDIDYVPIEEVA